MIKTLPELLEIIRSLIESAANDTSGDPTQRTLTLQFTPGDKTLKNLFTNKGGSFTIKILELPEQLTGLPLSEGEATFESLDTSDFASISSSR